MSDMLTHWAAFEDCCRLAQLDARIEPEFRRAAGEPRSRPVGHPARLAPNGCSPCWGVRDQWNEASRDPAGATSPCVGRLVHQATDNVMKPPLPRAAGGTWSQMQAYLRGTPGTPPSARRSWRRRTNTAYLTPKCSGRVTSTATPTRSRFALASSARRGARGLCVPCSSCCCRCTPQSDRRSHGGLAGEPFRTVQPAFVGVDRWVRVFKKRIPRRSKRTRCVRILSA